MSELAPESLMAAGYGLFLALCALGLDALARLSNRRSERYRTAGFTYMESVDAGSVPKENGCTGWRRTSTCDSCATALEHVLQQLSPQGRVHGLGQRPGDRAGAGLLAALRGGTLPPRHRAGDGRIRATRHLAGAGLNHAGGDLAVLGAAAFASTAIGLFLLADLRSTPSGFPWREAERSGARPAARELRG